MAFKRARYRNVFHQLDLRKAAYAFEQSAFDKQALIAGGDAGDA